MAFSQNNELATNPVFQKQCAKCHGKAAQGRRFAGPSLVSGRSTLLSEEELLNVIRNGKGRMPKYADKLAQEEIETLTRQIVKGRVR